MFIPSITICCLGERLKAFRWQHWSQRRRRSSNSSTIPYRWRRRYLTPAAATRRSRRITFGYPTPASPATLPVLRRRRWSPVLSRGGQFRLTAASPRRRQQPALLLPPHRDARPHQGGRDWWRWRIDDGGGGSGRSQYADADATDECKLQKSAKVSFTSFCLIIRFHEPV